MFIILAKTNQKQFCFVLFCELYYRQINQPTKIVTYKAAIAPACSALRQEPLRPANLCLRNQKAKFSTLVIG